MHLLMILTALGLAWWLRFHNSSHPQGSWDRRWQQVMSLFLLPPLLLTMTAISIVYMGAEEVPLLWQWQGRFSYLLASGFLGLAGILLVKQAIQSWQMYRRMRTCPQHKLLGVSSRVLDNPIPFSALIGLWQPQLVVTQGLLHTLDNEHLKAVFKHEQGHSHYQDPFWFFWLGWMRSYTTWLPQTEALWQELLLLREMRADFWAAQQVDPLLLAESLLQVASNVSVLSDDCCTAFSCTVGRDRLQERIDALLSPDLSVQQSSLLSWNWLLPILPLLVVPFHTCTHLTNQALLKG